MHRPTHMLRFERQIMHLVNICLTLQHHSILRLFLHSLKPPLHPFLLTPPLHPLHHKRNVDIVLALRHIHPPALIAIPRAIRQKRLQEVIVVPVKRHVDGGRATPLEKGVVAGARLGGAHAEARTAVALVGGVARHRARRAGQVRLQQRGVAQRRAQRRRDARRVPRRQRRVPGGRRAARDGRQRRAPVQVRLPVREVERGVQRVPPQHARQARAELGGVGGRDVRVRLSVEAEEGAP